MSMPLKAGLQRFCPRLYRVAATVFGRYMEGRYRAVQQKVIGHLGLTVYSGPFKGMRYISEAFYGPLDSKVIGCYEAELQGVIDEVIRSGYRIAVDVGCAEGYYAVGLARALPQSKMYAYDTDERARELCRELAEINNVSDRISISGHCGFEELNSIPLDNAFLMCDCEGFELTLLDPQHVPGLTSCDILVELHDFIDSSISEIIISRFRETHNIELFDTVAREPKEYPQVSFLSQRDRKLAISDRRWKPVKWAYLTRKNK